MLIEVKSTAAVRVGFRSHAGHLAQEGRRRGRARREPDRHRDRQGRARDPAPADGVLVKIIKQGGDTVTSGELIAQIDTEAKAAAGAAAAAPAAAPAAAAPAAAAAASSAAGAASPAARKILDEKGIAAGDVAGSGRGGRVTKEDAVAAQPKAAAAAASAAVQLTGDRPEERVPMTRLRARIAERLIQSKNENAI